MASENYRAPSVAQSAELAEQQGDPPDPSVIVPTLRAMVRNYSGGHRWDHLDARMSRAAADRLEMLEAALAATGKQQVGEPEIEFQARLMDVKTDLPTENWHHSPTYEENPGRGTHYWVQYRKRYIYYTPPAQGIDLGEFREAVLFWQEHGAGDADEIESVSHRLLALIDQRDAAPGVTQFAGWQIWDAASEAWESATEQLYWVVKRARPDEAREVFTPAPVTLSTIKPPSDLRTRLREDV